jgi:hypothetical protein
MVSYLLIVPIALSNIHFFICIVGWIQRKKDWLEVLFGGSRVALPKLTLTIYAGLTAAAAAF